MYHTKVADRLAGPLPQRKLRNFDINQLLNPTDICEEFRSIFIIQCHGKNCFSAIFCKMTPISYLLTHRNVSERFKFTNFLDSL